MNSPRLRTLRRVASCCHDWPQLPDVALGPTRANVAYLPLWQAGVGTWKKMEKGLVSGNSRHSKHSLFVKIRLTRQIPYPSSPE